MSKPPLSTHVLDTASGRPASGVPVRLFRLDPQGWSLLSEGATGADGRLATLTSRADFAAGTYKLRFDTAAYHAALGVRTLYPFVEVAFTSQDEEHYHIPLLISPYGYSTYRGS